MSKDKLLRVDQAAVLLNVSTKTIYRLASEGQFRCLKVRGGLRILESSVWAYVDRSIALFGLEHGTPENLGSDVDRDSLDSLKSASVLDRVRS